MKKSQDNRNQGFSSFFYYVEGRIRIHTNNLRMRMLIQKAQKYPDPKDPDPEHRRKEDMG
jgi:hypothetical protein